MIINISRSVIFLRAILQAGPNHGLSNFRLGNCGFFGLNVSDATLLKIRVI